MTTTEEVRRLYAFTLAGDRIHRTDEHFAEFDQWLAAHDAAVRAAGVAEGIRRAKEAIGGWGQSPPALWRETLDALESEK